MNNNRPPWIRFQLDRWDLLRYQLTPTEFHSYFSLFMEATRTEGRLPLLTSKAAKRAGVPEAILRSLIEHHSELFETESDALVVVHAALELSRALRMSELRKGSGKKGAAARWGSVHVVDGGGDDHD